MNSQYQKKTMLKEKAALLQTHDTGKNCSRKSLGITLLIHLNQREKLEKSLQILKSTFR